MKVIKFLFSLLGVILLSTFIYIMITYLSKNAITQFYKWHDKRHDWLSEYKDMPIKDKYKIVFIISDPTIIADREAGLRMIRACNNLGWEVHYFEMIEGNEKAIEEINPDFILTNKWNLHFGLKKKLDKYKFYALIPHPTTSYFSSFLNFYPQFKEKKFPELKFIDGFVISMPQISLIKNYVEGLGKKFYGFYGYSSVEHQDFVEVEPKELVYMGMNWDSRRKSGKFSKIFKQLAQKYNTVFYGSSNSWKDQVGDAYKGFFPSEDNAVLNKLRQSGITLILHSKQHINTGTPSGRAFEAAAAGVIGISDRHPFLIEKFGDGFLYIDVEASADRVTKQIENHLRWIKQNPEKAKQKARKNYDIFVENFTLEKLLINVAKMHERVLQDEHKARH